jgi:predicted nuclease with TOPRIM domain
VAKGQKEAWIAERQQLSDALSAATAEARAARSDCSALAAAKAQLEEAEGQLRQEVASLKDACGRMRRLLEEGAEANKQLVDRLEAVRARLARSHAAWMGLGCGWRFNTGPKHERLPV